MYKYSTVPVEYVGNCVFVYDLSSCTPIFSETVTFGSLTNIISDSFGVVGFVGNCLDHLTLILLRHSDGTFILFIVEISPINVTVDGPGGVSS